MKKVLPILMSVIYLTLSTGVLVNLHYCQGEIESVSIITNTSKCCCASMDFEDGCCSNEQLVIQLDIDEQLVSNSFIFSTVFEFINSADDLMNQILITSVEEEIYTYGDLSPPPKLAIWKTNCTFLYYG